ncbi:Crp/Fnr family transcriptional regulator [Algoriphagus halophytocola]|uniref:Crp/Fnr family transcriptional regulator n=1 Tax=Algoriphagus halophytocola TaxID=2991499 RepID=UPI0022DE46F0|nr:Crp/Fnr family transcriptional regulator [Algoriphagus sp. TR-M9]WBL43571.1 Crp/Fnr family transcriptional regulator [Algoriphagus sp. TR-M9]
MATPVRPNNESYSSFRFYDKLSLTHGDQMSGMVKECVIKKNEYIYDPSSEHLYIYEILEGAIKLGSYTEDGEEFTFDVLLKGDFFGDLRYLNNQFFEFSKSLIDTKLRVYSRDFFKKMVIQSPETSEWFISYLVKRWCSAEKKLKKIHEKKALEKLTFIDSFFDLQVHDHKGKSYILLDLLTQKDLGDLIGVSRQTIASTARFRSLAV